MSALPLAVLLHLAASCTPTVAPETWLSVAHSESRFEPLAINDNSTGRIYAPETLAEATALASNLVTAGHSLDLGAAQINTAAGHLQRRGLPLAAAFDPCTSFRIGGEVLSDCYRRAPDADVQARLRAALGCYNGDKSGAYTRRVLASAERIVPAIRLAGDATSRQGVETEAVTLPAPPPPAPCAPAWDAWALAACQTRRSTPSPHPLGGGASPPGPLASPEIAAHAEPHAR